MSADTPEDKLKRELVNAFEQVMQEEKTPIERIHSYEIAEDNKTLFIMSTMADGSDCYISLCPGCPISVAHQPAPDEHDELRWFTRAALATVELAHPGYGEILRCALEHG